MVDSATRRGEKFAGLWLGVCVRSHDERSFLDAASPGGEEAHQVGRDSGQVGDQPLAVSRVHKLSDVDKVRDRHKGDPWPSLALCARNLCVRSLVKLIATK